MKKKVFHIVLPVFALIALIFSITYVILIRPSEISIRPPIIPVSTGTQIENHILAVSATGIIESASGNIEIGTHLSGIVDKVYVKVGDLVDKNTPFFKIDTTEFHADQLVKEAQVQIAQAELDNAVSRLKPYKSIRYKEAIAMEDLITRQNELTKAQARLKEAKANLNKANKYLVLSTVTSPINGEILQVNIHPGEFAQAGNLQKPLMIIGNTKYLNVRVDVDEYNLGKLHQDPIVLIYPTGYHRTQLHGKLLRIEPLLKPRKNISGTGDEIIDTRVLELIIQIEEKKPNVFIGQQVNVVIKSDSRKPLLSISFQPSNHE